MKRVALINDLSGLGGCSLTASISVLSALGVEACPLPTAVLSNQTEFESFYMLDMTDKMELFAEQWKKLDISFDAILVGFLADVNQAETVKKFIEQFKKDNTLLLIDPVMGGDGACYKTLTADLCEKIRNLSFEADIITPNLTEAEILLGKDIELNVTLGEARSFAEELLKKGPSKVIITDVVIGDKIYNIIGENGEIFEICAQRIGKSYSGTGDLLASVITAGVLNGFSVKNSVVAAAKFIEKAVEEAFNNKTDRNFGIPFQKYLPLLWEQFK